MNRRLVRLMRQLATRRGPLSAVFLVVGMGMAIYTDGRVDEPSRTILFAALIPLDIFTAGWLIRLNRARTLPAPPPFPDRSLPRTRSNTTAEEWSDAGD